MSKMVQCDRDCIQFDGSIILNIHNPTLQIKH